MPDEKDCLKLYKAEPSAHLDLANWSSTLITEQGGPWKHQQELITMLMLDQI